MSCLFCGIVRGEVAAVQVWADADTLAFLDHRPLFPGHVLLVPRQHHETLADLPAPLLQPRFSIAQRLCSAMIEALAAEGSFVAMNNNVSQSVPHLHVHVVPRRKKDGLKGFFWPRGKYSGPEEMERIAGLLRASLS